MKSKVIGASLVVLAVVFGWHATIATTKTPCQQACQAQYEECRNKIIDDFRSHAINGTEAKLADKSCQSAYAACMKEKCGVDDRECCP